MLKPVEVVAAPVTEGNHHLIHVCRQFAEVVAAIRLGHDH